MIAFRTGTVPLFFYFSYKPYQTMSPMPCLNHDIQLLLAGERCLVPGGLWHHGMLQKDVWISFLLRLWSPDMVHQQQPWCPSLLYCHQHKGPPYNCRVRDSREWHGGNSATIKAGFKKLVTKVQLTGWQKGLHAAFCSEPVLLWHPSPCCPRGHNFLLHAMLSPWKSLPPCSHAAFTKNSPHKLSACFLS